MTYFVNTENTGLLSDKKVCALANILRNAGYDVEFTPNYGHVNPSECCPCTDAVWEKALIAADAEEA